MNKDRDDVWPPPPARQDGAEACSRSEPRRAGVAFGIASLALTLPGLLLWALVVLNGHVMLWTHFAETMAAFKYSSTALALLLPFFGFWAGVIGWRSVQGKIGMVASVLHYGFVFVVIFWIDPI